MKAKVTWIMVADGASAKVFEHKGPGNGLHALPDLTFEQAHLKASDIISDRDRGTYSGSAARGHGQGGYEPQTDPVDHREAQFVGGVAEMLDKKQREGAFDQLIIAADPTSLGNIRKKLSKQVQQALVAELPKDLTNVPTAKLGEHFDGIVAV
jgi:protein required for attachment to host cells